nr:RICIN domain-containing protein [Fibrobacter sp.]
MKRFVFESVLTRYIKIVCAGLFVVSSAFAAGSTLKGNITYTLHKSESPTDDDLDAYTRITAVMDSAVKIYNTYTALTKHINVYYAPGVPTAEASSNGDLRFGKERSYMFVGTAMHEMAHTLGMGTTTEYRNMLDGGVFKGEKAQAKLKDLTGDETQVLKGDSQHFWPYGLNYASEVKSEEDLIFHAQIVEAMYQDIFKEAFYRSGHLKNLLTGACLGITSDNALKLMDCSDTATFVKMYSVGEPVAYRIQLGTRVVDVPNESTASGVTLGTYGWNGGAHQKYYMEFALGSNVQNQGAADTVFLLLNVKSRCYMKADGDLVKQELSSNPDQAFAWMWVGEDRSITDSSKVDSSATDTTLADSSVTSLVRKLYSENRLQKKYKNFDVRGRRVNESTNVMGGKRRKMHQVIFKH